MGAKDHYESLLAARYTWMFGVPFAEKVAEQRSLLERLEALPTRRGRAIDLGCGSGFQSIALANLGFAEIVAVDQSPTLLAELESYREQRSIRTVDSDLTDFLASAEKSATDLIVCMGDTLTHLASREQVTRLFRAAAGALAPGGVFALTYRDLSEEINGDARFIPVAGDATRILTCFLEYHEHDVTVHDLLNEFDGKGWRLRVSSYRKLRLPVAWIVEELRAAGFSNVHAVPAGRLQGIVARPTAKAV